MGREAELLRRITSPYVPRFREKGVWEHPSGAFPYVVMELVEGEEIRGGCWFLFLPRCWPPSETAPPSYSPDVQEIARRPSNPLWKGGGGSAPERPARYVCPSPWVLRYR